MFQIWSEWEQLLNSVCVCVALSHYEANCLISSGGLQRQIKMILFLWIALDSNMKTVKQPP